MPFIRRCFTDTTLRCFYYELSVTLSTDNPMTPTLQFCQFAASGHAETQENTILLTLSD